MASLKYLQHAAPRKLPGGNPLLILLHGFGSNEADLFGLANYLDDRLTVVSARAPRTMQPGSYAWYPIEFTPNGITMDPSAAEAAVLAVDAFVREMKAAHAPTKTFLGGFSQGAIMSAYLAAEQPELVDGLVLMSGRLIRRPDVTTVVRPRVPAIVTHGTFDEVLPVANGRDSARQLKAAGHEVTYHEYQMAHTISEEALEDVNRWLEKQLGA